MTFFTVSIGRNNRTIDGGQQSWSVRVAQLPEFFLPGSKTLPPGKTLSICLFIHRSTARRNFRFSDDFLSNVSQFDKEIRRENCML